MKKALLPQIELRKSELLKPGPRGKSPAYPWPGWPNEDGYGFAAPFELGIPMPYLLRYTSMPTVLVEPGFDDNPSHREILFRRDGAVRYAAAVLNGIMAYLDETAEED